MNKNNNWDPKGRKKFVFIWKGEKRIFIGLESTLKRDFPNCEIVKQWNMKILNNISYIAEVLAL